MSRKLKSHFLMILLIMIWTLDVLVTSIAVSHMNQIFVIFCRYMVAVGPIFIITQWIEPIHFPKLKDLGFIVLSSILGDLLYFYFEFTALKYATGALVTVLLGTLPLASLIVESIVEKKKLSLKKLLFIACSFFGINLILREEIGILDQNALLAALFCLIAVAIWIIYGYVVKKINTSYSDLHITFYQCVCAIIIMAPIALTHLPTTPIPFKSVLIELILMGFLSSGIGVMIEIRGLTNLGLVPTGIYLNMLPITTVIAEYFLYQTTLTSLQTIGFILTIVFSFLALIDQN